MKKLNATNAIAILSLGLIFSVVVAGCGGGNDTGESAVTKNAKAGSSDGGTGKSVTVSDSDFETCDGEDDTVCKENVASLTNVQMNALTSDQWELVDGYLSASQVASIPTKTIQNLSTDVLDGFSWEPTMALTTAQLKSMSKDQLDALTGSQCELTDSQLVTVEARYQTQNWEYGVVDCKDFESSTLGD